AYAAWNVLRPQSQTAPTLSTRMPQLTLEGVGLPLRSGDLLLCRIGGASPILPRIARVVPGKSRQRTILELVDAPASVLQATSTDVQLQGFRKKVSLFGYNAPDWRALPASVQMAYTPSPGPGVPVGTPVVWPWIRREDRRLR